MQTAGASGYKEAEAALGSTGRGFEDARGLALGPNLTRRQCLSFHPSSNAAVYFRLPAWVKLLF